MANDELREFMVDRLRDLDPTLDLTEGSNAWIKVIDPLLRRLGPDPFAVDTLEFITDRIRQEFPQLGIEDAGSPWADIIAEPHELLLEPFKREINAIKGSLSMADAEVMSEREMDSLAANVFEVRNEGAYAVVTARVYFYRPQRITLDGTSYSVTSSGLRFFTAEVTTLFAEQMQLNQESGLYYMDVLQQAETEGAQYNIGAGELVSIEGIPNAAKVTNPSPGSGGVDRENNEQFLERIQRSISERAPVTDRGIRALLERSYPDLQAMTTIGYNDIEMVRDIIKGSVELRSGQFGLGSVIVEGSATATGDAFPTGSGRYLEDITAHLVTTGGAFSSIQQGDIIHIDEMDREVLVVDDSNNLHLVDVQNVYATSSASGHRDYNVRSRGSDLPITNVYDDDDSQFYASGADGGMYLVFFESSAYSLENFREIDTLLSASQVKIVPDIQNRRVGFGVSLAASTICCFYVPGTANDTNMVVGAEVEWDSSTYTAEIEYIDKTLGILCLKAISGGTDKLNPGAQIDGKTVTGDVTLDDPSKSPVMYYNGSYEFYVTDVIDVTGDGGYNLTEPDPSTSGPKVRAGDWLAVTDLDDPDNPSTPYGMYKIQSVTPGMITVDSSITYPGGFPSTARPLSWTIIDADYFDAPATGEGLETIFFPATGPAATPVLEHFAVFTFGDYVTDPFTFSFVEYPGSLAYTIRRYLTEEDVDVNLLLTLSDIPGGILTPNTPEGTIEIKDDEIHVGGMTDVYIKPQSNPQDFYTLSIIRDNDPIVEGVSLTWSAGEDTVTSAELAGLDLAGSVLVILEGEQAGAYRIIEKDPVSIVARLDVELSGAGTNIRFYVTDEVRVDLSSPKIFRLQGQDNLVTTLGDEVKAVETPGSPPTYVNFSEYGVSKNDSIEIEEGFDKGIYNIDDITDGGETLVLSADMKGIASNVSYNIYKGLLPITRPLVRVTQIDLLQADGSEMGLTVPLKDPVDIRTGEMSNAGLGLKIPNVNRRNPECVFGTDGGGSYVQDLTGDFIDDNVVRGDIIVIEEGDNLGPYIISSVSSSSKVYVENDDGWATTSGSSEYYVGAPSTGTARVYFENATFFEVNEDTVFEAGTGRTYRGDIYSRATIAEFIDSTTDIESNPGSSDSDAIESESIDFMSYEIRSEVNDGTGDRAILTTVAVPGAALASDDVNVDGLKITLEFDGDAEKAITFEYPGGDPVPLDEPGYPGGVRQQLESTFSDLLVEVYDSGSDYTLIFHSDRKFWFRGGTAMGPLGLSSLTNTSNAHPQADEYVVYDIEKLTGPDRWLMTLRNVNGTIPALDNRTRVRVVFQRRRVQRTGPNEMTTRQDVTGLYYFDVDIMSIWPGDENSLAAGTSLSVAGHRSFGYALSSRNEALTFSLREELDLILTPYIMDPILDDKFTDLIMIPDKELRFTIERCPTASSIQSFLTSDYQRVVNNNPLARHYQPAYVKLYVQYARGSASSIVKQQIVDLINGLSPSETLTSYSLSRVLVRNGATRATGPIELVAVVHNMDRSISALRSTSQLSTNRTTHLIADETWIQVVRTV